MNLRQIFINQNWWGKLIGGFFGFLTAGPLGLLFGILIGNFFDRGLVDHFANPHWYYHTEKNKLVQKIFLEAVFSIAGQLAKADGRVSEQEILAAKKLMKEMSLNKAEMKDAKHYFNLGKQPDFDPKMLLEKFRKLSQHNRGLLKLFMDLQYSIAQIDGFSPQKQATFNSILQKMGYAPLHEQHQFHEFFQARWDHSQTKHKQHQEQQHSSYRQSPYSHSHFQLQQAYNLLGISPTTPKQEVKRAYRRLIGQNHPDRLIAKGLSEELIKKANEKTQQIRKAYENICESKGW